MAFTFPRICGRWSLGVFFVGAAGLRADYRAPDQRTVYDGWIADSRYKQETDRKEKESAQRATTSGGKDYSADLAWLNQQSRLQAEWAAEERAMEGRRAAREAARAARQAEIRELTRLSEAAQTGDPEALMTMGRRNESTAFLSWGIADYQMVFGARRVEALWRVVELLRTHASEPDRLSRFRPIDSFLGELAGLGEAKAAGQLARLRHESGEDDAAAKYFAQAGESGDREARRGAISLVAEDRVDAVPVEPLTFARWCEAEATDGYLAAQYAYGRMASRGEEIPRDPTKALQLLRQAVAQESSRLAPAQRLIQAQAAELAGRMTRDGVGAPANPAAGIALLETAAAGGSTTALTQLGKTFLLGLGVKPDPERARSWLVRAAERDDATAATLLSLLCLRPEADALEQAEGIRWLTRVAKRTPEAMLRYGRILFNGEYGLERDAEEAMAYLRLAFERYPRDGQVLDFVGTSYIEGSFGARQNAAEGIRILKLAYTQGSTRSALRLAEVYRTGQGVPADPAEAQRWQARVQ